METLSVWYVQVKNRSLFREQERWVNASELLLAANLESAIDAVKAKHPDGEILGINHRGVLTIQPDRPAR